MITDPRQYFTSLENLSQDIGSIGQVLRRYQDLLPAADKWAEQTFDYRKQHEDRNRLPVPDPWQFLIDAPAVSLIDKAVFRAAQSQLPALRHLIRMSQGIATVNTDWYQESVEARAKGDESKYNRAVSKVADAHVFNERVQADVRMQNDPALQKQMEWLLKHRRTQLVHRGNRDAMERLKKWPSWKEFGSHNRLPVVLVEWWVRCGVNGLPGLMFWRNEALTKFLNAHLDQTNLSPQTVKKTRQQLGLIPVSEKKHSVWDFSITTKGDGSREIKCVRRNGQQSFCGVILPTKQISEAVLLAVE